MVSGSVGDLVGLGVVALLVCGHFLLWYGGGGFPGLLGFQVPCGLGWFGCVACDLVV